MRTNIDVHNTWWQQDGERLSRVADAARTSRALRPVSQNTRVETQFLDMPPGAPKVTFSMLSKLRAELAVSSKQQDYTTPVIKPNPALHRHASNSSSSSAPPPHTPRNGTPSTSTSTSTSTTSTASDFSASNVYPSTSSSKNPTTATTTNIPSTMGVSSFDDDGDPNKENEFDDDYLNPEEIRAMERLTEQAEAELMRSGRLAGTPALTPHNSFCPSSSSSSSSSSNNHNSRYSSSSSSTINMNNASNPTPLSGASNLSVHSAVSSTFPTPAPRQPQFHSQLHSAVAPASSTSTVSFCTPSIHPTTSNIPTNDTELRAIYEVEMELEMVQRRLEVLKAQYERKHRRKDPPRPANFTPTSTPTPARSDGDISGRSGLGGSFGDFHTPFNARMNSGRNVMPNSAAPSSAFHTPMVSNTPYNHVVSGTAIHAMASPCTPRAQGGYDDDVISVTSSQSPSHSGLHRPITSVSGGASYEGVGGGDGGSTSSTGHDGRQCDCGELARRGLSSSAKNPDRWYYSCSKRADEDRCDYFEWEDGIRGNMYDDSGPPADFTELGEDTKDPNAVIKEMFGHNGFRQGQRDVIEHAMKGDDVFVLLPTGGGKSLCYQLPAYCCPGVAVVFSPLLSLIQDQVEAMNAAGVTSVFINSSQEHEEVRSIMNELGHLPNHGSIKLLYITPEKLSRSEWMKNVLMRLYRSGKLSRFVIDEAHCISQWGHDFRTDYLQLRILRSNYPNVPIMALTATANEGIVKDISTKLQLRPDHFKFRSSFNRPNLRYKILEKNKKSTEEIAKYIKQRRNQSGIIYCLSRKDCEKMSDNLRRLVPEMQHQINFYHAELENAIREQRHRDWSRGRIKLIVATIAFGMGINKPDVRYVIHFSLPKSLTHYYQESGRAGRDGLESDCLLYFSFRDKAIHEMMVRKSDSSRDKKEAELENIHKVVRYCMDEVTCRRRQTLQHFGEVFDAKQCRGTCDNCANGAETISKDMSIAAQQIAVLFQSMTSRHPNVSLAQLVQAYRGSNNKLMKTHRFNEAENFGQGKGTPLKEVERLVQELTVRNFFMEEARENAAGYSADYLAPGRRFNEMRQGRAKVCILFRSKARKSVTSSASAAGSASSGSRKRKSPQQQREAGATKGKASAKKATQGKTPNKRKTKNLSSRARADAEIEMAIAASDDEIVIDDSDSDVEPQGPNSKRQSTGRGRKTSSKFGASSGMSQFSYLNRRHQNRKLPGHRLTVQQEEKLAEKLNDLGNSRFSAWYHMCTSEARSEICRTVPLTIEELRQIDGINGVTARKHGKDIIDVLKQFLEEDEVVLEGTFSDYHNKGGDGQMDVSGDYDDGDEDADDDEGGLAHGAGASARKLAPAYDDFDSDFDDEEFGDD